MRAALLKYLEVLNTEDLEHSILTVDGVHFNTVGHHFILKCLCTALGLPLPEPLPAPKSYGTKNVLFRHSHEEIFGDSHKAVEFDL